MWWLVCHSGKKCVVLEYQAEVGMFYTLKELSPHTPLDKGGKGGSNEISLNKGEIED